jgi:hypothetical protein
MAAESFGNMCPASGLCVMKKSAKILNRTDNLKSQTWPLYTGAVLVYGIVFWFWQVQSVPVSLYMAGVALWAMALLPLALWYRKGFQGLPMFELICVAYGLAYGPPIYLVPNQIMIMSQSVALPYEIMLHASLSALLGLAALITGYHLFGSQVRQTGLPQLDLPLASDQRISFAYFALAIGLGATFVEPFAGERFRAIVHLFESQSQIGIVVLTYLVFGHKQARLDTKLLLFASVALWVILGLAGGMLESVMTPLVLVFIVYWHARRRFPWGLALLISAGILILTPLKLAYRDRVWSGSEGNGGTLARLNVWWEVAGDTIAGERSGLEQQDPVGETMGRVDLLHKLAYVQSLTPNEVPYFEGKSYLYLVYTFIPRVLWPGKPVASDATDLMDFGYRLRSEENTGTKIAIGLIGEAFANFGWMGIVTVLFLQGLFFRTVNQVLNGPQSDGGRAIYLSIMVIFLNGVGTSAVILFGSVIQITIASATLMRPFALGFSASSGAARMTRQKRRKVRALLQANQSSRFHERNRPVTAEQPPAEEKS